MEPGHELSESHKEEIACVAQKMECLNEAAPAVDQLLYRSSRRMTENAIVGGLCSYINQEYVCHINTFVSDLSFGMFAF